MTIEGRRKCACPIYRNRTLSGENSMEDQRMRFRVLSREESESLSTEAVKFVYDAINNDYYSPDTVEKTLLQAVLLARMNQCRVEADTFSFLFERISELEDIAPDNPTKDGDNTTYRYC